VLSIVVPVHDEEPGVEQLCGELERTLDPLGESWEAIFVDDGSDDGTFGALARLHETRPNLRAVRLRRNFGKSTALAAGIAQAEGDVIVTIDGDLQDDPAEIPALLLKLEEGFDLVTGWRKTRRDPRGRRVSSRLFNLLTALFSGLWLHDVNCGLKAFRTPTLRGLPLHGGAQLHRFLPVLAHQRGYRVTEVPVNHRPRAYGRSRYGTERYIHGLLDLLSVSLTRRYRWTTPGRMPDRERTKALVEDVLG
jgi:glycosyltransferase involved in cell wall biosynthesis